MTHPHRPATTIRTVPWFGAVQRFKRRYERLHPSVQQIGLQLWMPTMFVVLFALCYVLPFRSPAPHDLRIGVVGSAAAQQVDQALEKAAPGGYVVEEVDAVDAAALRSGAYAAVLDTSDASHPELSVATANSSSLAQIVEATFRSAIESEGVVLTVDDVAPLPVTDGAGTVSLYVSLVAAIGGHLTGMFTALMGGDLRRRARIGIVVGTTAVLGTLAATLIDPVVGALPGRFPALWLLLVGTMTAVGLTTQALGYYFGRWVVAAGLISFVFLNVPASGGAVAVDLLPQPFRWLNHVVIAGGDVPFIHAASYDVGPGEWVGLTRIAAYIAFALVITIPGPAYRHWRRSRRRRLGLPLGGMLETAQSLKDELPPETTVISTLEPPRGASASGGPASG
ncbi:hypothetical protein [Microbacterium indicum]|uniref:hypothetical protein n=1 Tax=Microbacterium indicum TaxID=358100 RepID=UPI00041BC7CB|nr:hypothetical protein [Microbacterium indicum]